MGEFLAYSIVSGLIMLLMFLAYRVFLAMEKQHDYNRRVLLMIYFVAFGILPLMSFVQQYMVQEIEPIWFVGYSDAVGSMVSSAEKPVWGTFLIRLFVAGMAVVAVKTLFIWIRLIKIIRSGEKVEHEGYTFVLTDEERFAPFSWIRYIVISRSDYANNASAIMAHEMKHIASHHWIDLLIAQGVCIINWFNPAAWLMREELMLVHEYQADMAVIDSGHNPREYQMLLIEKAVGARFPSLANSLNHSKLKKRITMMYKEKSSAGRKMKALALVPMLVLALSVTSVPAVRAAVSTISNSDVSTGKGTKKMPKKEVASFRVMNLNNNGHKTTVVIKGENVGDNISVSGGTFTTAGKTYEAKALQCDMTDGEATITATFPFTSEYENTGMTLVINGKEIKFDLEDFLHKVRIVKSEDATASNVMSDKGISLEKMEYYVDGKKIDFTEMKNLASNSIASITIDKSANSIIISTKK